MVTLSGSAAGNAAALNHYISQALAHDADNPNGPSDRVEIESTIGDCDPATFIPDMRRTRALHGKEELKVETYHYVLSHTHEECDPNDPSMGLVAHSLARAWAREALPGRQIKLTTQRDNGRWVEGSDGRVWQPGKWHTHVQVASVAESEVSLSWEAKDGHPAVTHYRAGRAMDGPLKNIHRLRGEVDRVVLRDLGYDNAAFIDVCREASNLGLSR